jgi:hypothetical protein
MVRPCRSGSIRSTSAHSSAVSPSARHGRIMLHDRCPLHVCMAAVTFERAGEPLIEAARIGQRAADQMSVSRNAIILRAVRLQGPVPSACSLPVRRCLKGRGVPTARAREAARGHRWCG